MRGSSPGFGDLGRLRQAALEERKERERLERERLERERKRADTAPADLSAADSALFRRAVGGAIPLKTDRRTLHAPPAPPADARARRERAIGGPVPAPAAGISDEFPATAGRYPDGSYVRPGASADLARRLRRRQWPVLANLDLHGMTVDTARDALDRFLAQCADNGIRCVRIVHGKGYGSPSGVSVLRERVAAWLAQQAAVLAYVPAGEADGGEGAVIALLAQPGRSPGTGSP